MSPSCHHDVVSLTSQGTQNAPHSQGTDAPFVEKSALPASETGANVRIIYEPCKKNDNFLCHLPLISYLCP